MSLTVINKNNILKELYEYLKSDKLKLDKNKYGLLIRGEDLRVLINGVDTPSGLTLINCYDKDLTNKILGYLSKEKAEGKIFFDISFTSPNNNKCKYIFYIYKNTKNKKISGENKDTIFAVKYNSNIEEILKKELEEFSKELTI